MNMPESPSLTDEQLALELKPYRKSISFRQFLNHFWQEFLHWAAARPEPRITQEFDRHGQRICWRVFDPETGKSASLGSELEVRQWLEERYRF